MINIILFDKESRNNFYFASCRHLDYFLSLLVEFSLFNLFEAEIFL